MNKREIVFHDLPDPWVEIEIPVGLPADAGTPSAAWKHSSGAILVHGKPPSEDAPDYDEERGHNCDAMGCGSVGPHIIWRADSQDDLIREALEDARDAIASLPEDALGMTINERDENGEAVNWWPIRDELLAKINSALDEAEVER